VIFLSEIAILSQLLFVAICKLLPSAICAVCNLDQRRRNWLLRHRVNSARQPSSSPEAVLRASPARKENFLIRSDEASLVPIPKLDPYPRKISNMTKISDSKAISLQRATTGRSYQHLSSHDQPRLTAFFLAFDFDERRSYFGSGISDESIVGFCRAIDWTRTDMIGRCGRYCLEAVAMLVATSDRARVELAIACPLKCDQRQIVAELLMTASSFAASKYSTLVVRRELAHPDLLNQLRQTERATAREEEIELDLRSAASHRSARRLLPVRA